MPQPGSYWASRRLALDVRLETVRAGQSREFDNSARLRSVGRVQQWWEKFESRIAPAFYHLLEESDLGRPAREELVVDNHAYMASVSSVEFAAMVTALAPHIRDAKVVHEIGGGYGGLASAMLRALPDVRWLIFDLPETARVARWYLGAQPRAHVLDSTRMEQILSWVAPADVVVQTRGFMEMSPDEVKFYFDLIQGGALLKRGGLFWTINRRHKVTDFADYPFDERWDVLKVEPWPENDMIEALLRRTDTAVGPVAERLGLTS